jgi:hypothetical protein
MHCDKVQDDLGIFQQIAPALNRWSIAFSKDVFNKNNTFLNWKKYNE